MRIQYDPDYSITCQPPNEASISACVQVLQCDTGIPPGYSKKESL